MADRTFLLKIAADVSDATRGIKNVEKSATTFKEKAKTIGKAVVTAFAVDQVIDFGKAAVTAASEAEQAAGSSQSVFESFAGQIDDFSQTTAKNLGIARGDFLQLTSVTGSLMKNAGLPLEQVTQNTIDLTSRASDLAAMFGGSVPDAVAAMNSAMKGEFDPLENFGVSLKQADINARAMADGLVDADGKVTKAGQAQAAYALIMEQSADAQGTFAAESGTLAGQQAIMSAQWKDLQATLGQQLLPVMAKFAGILTQVITFVQANQEWLVPLVAGIGTAVAAWYAWNAAIAIWNVLLAANPLGLTIIAIGAVAVAIGILWAKSETFRNIVIGAVNAVRAVFEALWNAIKFYARLMFEVYTKPYRLAFDFISKHIGAVMDFFRKIPGWINSAFHGLIDIIKYPFVQAFDAIKWMWNNTIGGFGFKVPDFVPLIGGKEFKIPMMAAGGIVTGPTFAMLGEAGPEAVIPLDRLATGTVINVYALNPTAETGRMIARALDEHRRVSGR